MKKCIVFSRSLTKNKILDTTLFFDNFYKNARYNGVLIMDTSGIILSINNAFKLRFGYEEEDLKGKNFSVLFIEKDRETKKPERELQLVNTEKSANDENYLLNKDGSKIWVTGESVLVENEKHQPFILKVVHNIHAQKQLERFLLQSHEFIDTIFDSVPETGLLLLDTSIRVINANKAFLEIFDLKQAIKEGSRLVEINHPFWQRQDVRQEVVNYLVLNNFVESKVFEAETTNGKLKKISVRGKVLDGTQKEERKLVIMINEVD